MNILFSPHRAALQQQQTAEENATPPPQPLPPPLFIRDKRSSLTNNNEAALSSVTSSPSQQSKPMHHSRPATAGSTRSRTISSTSQTQRSLHFSHRISATSSATTSTTRRPTSARVPTTTRRDDVSPIIRHEGEVHEEEEKVQESPIASIPHSLSPSVRTRPSSSPLRRGPLSSSTRAAGVADSTSITTTSSLSTSVHRHLRLVWDYLVGQVALANDIAAQCDVNREYRAIRITMEIQRTMEEQEEEERRVKNMQAMKNQNQRQGSKSPRSSPATSDSSSSSASTSTSTNLLHDDRYCIRVSSIHPQRHFLRDIPMESFHREMQHLVLIRDAHLHGHDRRPLSPNRTQQQSPPTTSISPSSTYTISSSSATATTSPPPLHSPRVASLSGDRVASLLSSIVTSTHAQTSELQRQVEILQKKGIHTIVWS